MGGSSSKANVIVVGLDNAGKTTILRRLQPKRGAALQEEGPTVGFSVEGFKQAGVQFTCFDMSGQRKYRSLWEQYYRDVTGIIFVVDSSDKLRLAVAKDEMEEMLQHADVKDKHIPILFFANKKDAAGALPPAEVARILELDRIHDKPWVIRPSNAVSGEGVEDGTSWLADQVKRAQRK